MNENHEQQEYQEPDETADALMADKIAQHARFHLQGSRQDMLSGVATLKAIYGPRSKAAGILVEALEESTKIQQSAILRAEAEETIRARRRAASVPDYSNIIKTATEILETQGDSPRWVIEGMVEAETNNILVAPTNKGGGTALVNIAASLLTNRPFLNRAVAPERFGVIWVNPEETERMPVVRLKKIVGDDPDVFDRFVNIHTRNKRLYLNVPSYTEALLPLLQPRLDELRAKGCEEFALIVDGMQPTLLGNPWNEDLEAWKLGIAVLADSMMPVTFVRTQINSAAARKASKDGTEILGEDVGGGQILQWPDNRLIMSPLGEDRKLLVRVREGTEYSLLYSYDRTTGAIYEKVDKGSEGRRLVLDYMLQEAYKEIPTGNNQGPNKARSVVRDILAKAAQNGGTQYEHSEDSLRRILNKEWAWSDHHQEWRSASTAHTGLTTEQVIAWTKGDDSE